MTCDCQVSEWRSVRIWGTQWEQRIVISAMLRLIASNTVQLWTRSCIQSLFILPSFPLLVPVGSSCSKERLVIIIAGLFDRPGAVLAYNQQTVSKHWSKFVVLTLSYGTIRYNTIYLRALKNWRERQLDVAHGTKNKIIRKNCCGILLTKLVVVVKIEGITVLSNSILAFSFIVLHKVQFCNTVLNTEMQLVNIALFGMW